ncbi:hypothetical protein EON67_09835, partial [archaeon]
MLVRARLVTCTQGAGRYTFVCACTCTLSRHLQVAPEGSSAPPTPPMPPALPALTGVEWTYGITTHSTG